MSYLDVEFIYLFIFVVSKMERHSIKDLNSLHVRFASSILIIKLIFFPKLLVC